MERVIVRSSRRHWVVMLIGSMTFVAAGVLVLAMGANPLAAWSAIVFFGGCALVGTWQILDSRPRLVIGERGVFDRTLKIGVIEWQDINGAFVKRLQGNTFVCLELRDPAKYTGTLSPTGRRLAEVNRNLGFTPISLNLTGLNVDADRVCELLLKEAAVRRVGR